MALQLLHQLQPADVVARVVARAALADRRRHQPAGGVEAHVADAHADAPAELVERQQLLVVHHTSVRRVRVRPHHLSLLTVTPMVSQSRHAICVRARSLRLRPPPHPAWQGQGRRVAARGEAGRPRGRPDRRAEGAQPRPRHHAHRRRRPRRGLAGRRPGRRHRQDRRTGGRAAGDHGRRTAQPVLRLGARGGQPGRVTGPRRLRGADPRRRRRVDEPGGHGLRRRRLGVRPGHRADDRLRAAGHRRRPDRHPRGLEPRRRRRVRRRVQPPRGQGVGQRLLREVGRPGQGPQRRRRPRPRRADPPRHHGRGAGRAQAELRPDRRGRRLRRRRAREVPLGREDQPRPPRRQLLGHRRRLGARR